MAKFHSDDAGIKARRQWIAERAISTPDEMRTEDIATELGVEAATIRRDLKSDEYHKLLQAEIKQDTFGNLLGKAHRNIAHAIEFEHTKGRCDTAKWVIEKLGTFDDIESEGPGDFNKWVFYMNEHQCPQCAATEEDG